MTDVMTDDAKVGDEVEITAQVNNLGEGMLYNVNCPRGRKTRGEAGDIHRQY